MPNHRPRYVSLIPAAGVGARMRADGPKQYLPLAGRPMIAHTVAAFLACERIAHTFIVVSSDDALIDGVLASLPGHADRVTVLRCGGATRMDSILNGLQAMGAWIGPDDRVLVHDAARPGLTPALIARLIEGVGDHPAGGLLALPVVDTVKQEGQGGSALRTVARDSLWLAQTPQLFSFSLLRTALESARAAGRHAAITDDASAVEALGMAPRLVEGHPCNLKVTLPRDLAIAAMYLAQAASSHSLST